MVGGRLTWGGCNEKLFSGRNEIIRSSGWGSETLAGARANSGLKALVQNGASGAHRRRCRPPQPNDGSADKFLELLKLYQGNWSDSSTLALQTHILRSEQVCMPYKIF